MTAREHLSRRSRLVGGTVFAGVGLFIAGGLISEALGRPPNPAVVLPGFVVAVGAAMVAQFTAFRCPRCRGNLAPLIAQRIGRKVDPRLSFCPYCAAGIDDELPAPGGYNQPV